MKIYLHNPASGAPIKNWFDGSDRWSLAVNEVKAFPESVARSLKAIFAFLEEINESEAEVKLADLEKEIPVVKVVGGEIVAKVPAEIALEKEIVEEKKAKIKKLVEKVKKAPEAKPEKPNYSELNRGELIAECHKRKVEIKGLGKAYVSKEQVIALLENDDAQK